MAKRGLRSIDTGIGLCDVSVYLLSEFNKKLLKINYRGAWCNEVGPVTADYQAGEQIITGTFSLKYAFTEVIPLESKLNYPFTTAT